MKQEKEVCKLMLYLEPEVFEMIERQAAAFCQSKAGAAEMLIKKALGLLGDAEIEMIVRLARTESK